MWFIGVEVEQETSAPPPKKILHPPLLCGNAVIKPLVIYFINISDKFAFALYPLLSPLAAYLRLNLE